MSITQESHFKEMTAVPPEQSRADFRVRVQDGYERAETKTILKIIEGLSVREGLGKLQEGWNEPGDISRHMAALQLIKGAVSSVLEKVSQPGNGVINQIPDKIKSDVDGRFAEKMADLNLNAKDQAIMYSAHEAALRTAREGIDLLQLYSPQQSLKVGFLKKIKSENGQGSQHLGRVDFVIEGLSVHEGIRQLQKSWKGTGDISSIIVWIADSVESSLRDAQHGTHEYDSFQQFKGVNQKRDEALDKRLAKMEIGDEDRKALYEAREAALKTAYEGTRLATFHTLGRP